MDRLGSAAGHRARDGRTARVPRAPPDRRPSAGRGAARGRGGVRVARDRAVRRGVVVEAQHQRPGQLGRRSSSGADHGGRPGWGIEVRYARRAGGRGTVPRAGGSAGRVRRRRDGREPRSAPRLASRRAGAGRRGRDCGPVASRGRHLRKRRPGGRPCADSHTAHHRRRVARLETGPSPTSGSCWTAALPPHASPTGWSACWPTRSRAARRG